MRDLFCLHGQAKGHSNLSCVYRSFSRLLSKLTETFLDSIRQFFADVNTRVASLLYTSRFFFVSLLSPHSMVSFHKKIIPEQVDYNRTTGKGADQALKFIIHQCFEFKEFLKNGKTY